MASTAIQRQLVDAGNRLANPPSSVDELLPLLGQVESYLAKLEQSPTDSTQRALAPAQNALVTDQLLRHPDADVRVAVAACISEILRITAPNVPYDDEQMVGVLELIVSSFDNLDDTTNRAYSKTVVMLESMARVRACVLMLDLQCDALITDMFHKFFNTVRDYHPENVVSAMETIMTLVIQESEDNVPLETITTLLASVDEGNEAR
ncbi:unnamed protein product [Linum tenue]|uniref:Sister chromatid cohesion protein n=1 Tax=Linum tenue TaxID=586396 RepID=A0AAV0K556_9ROSI|nr:unnamed protein product [Linum tenue]